MEEDMPLKNTMQVIKSFNSILKLSSLEKDILFPLIKIRLAFLVLMTCHEYYDNPTNEYLLRNKVSLNWYLKVFSSVISN